MRRELGFLLNGLRIIMDVRYLIIYLVSLNLLSIFIIDFEVVGVVFFFTIRFYVSLVC